MQLHDYIEEVAQRLAKAQLYYGHGTDNPYDESIYLVYSVLAIDFAQDPKRIDRTIATAERQQLETLLAQRIEQRTPVAYLVGEAWFAGYRFKCDERALIPRSPIAELIGAGFAALISSTPDSILDLCCGGGCIGIACALQFPDAHVDLADISKDCLALAKTNIALHGVADRVTAVHADLFTGLTDSYDLILCNPPYVSQEEIDSLPAEYRHEPESGLFSADDGLQIPLEILRTAAGYLHSDGLLIMEVGYSADALAQRLANIPLLWLEFAEGGEGVFALTAKQLKKYQNQFI